MTSFLNIATIRVCTEAEGPGKRFAIWVQGCKKRCPGCCNPEMQALEKRHVVSVEDLFTLIASAKKEYGIEGVTYIGGEPFLQTEGLAELSSLCHAINLSVLAFSGYTLQELNNDKNSVSLLKEVDLLVDGPYLESVKEKNRGWIGSENQQIHFFSNRYKPGIENESANSVEIIVNKKDLLFNGWPGFIGTES